MIHFPKIESPLDNPHFHIILKKLQTLINTGIAKNNNVSSEPS
jgi:hypothetical protein